MNYDYITISQFHELLQKEYDLLELLDSSLAELSNPPFFEYTSIYLRKNQLFDRTFAEKTLHRLLLFKEGIGKGLVILTKPAVEMYKEFENKKETVKSLIQSVKDSSFDLLFFLQFPGKCKGEFKSLLTWAYDLMLEFEDSHLRSIEPSRALETIRKRLYGIKRKDASKVQRSKFEEIYDKREAELLEFLKHHILEGEPVAPKIDIGAIKGLIGEGSLKKAFAAIERSLGKDYDLINDFYLIKSRFYNLKKKQNSGLSNNDDLDVELNKISKSLLGFVDSFHKKRHD